MAGVSSVTVLAMVGVGSRFESKRMNGISHFLEHMVFKGSDKWPQPQDILTTVDGIGARFNAFTGKEYTGFYIQAGVDHMVLAADVLSDMLYTSKLRSADIEREKGVIREEINMYNDQPQSKVNHLFDEAMYGDTGLGRRIDGMHHTVDAFKRADFTSHMENWYGLDNTVVVIAGGVGGKDYSVPKVEEIILQSFGRKGKVFGKTEVEREYSHKEQGEIQVTVASKESDQAHLVLGFPSYNLNHPDRYAVSLLETILGGNMSSRLFSEVREKRGLAYYARCDVDRFHDVGALAAVEGVNVDKVEEAVTVTMQVFEDVKGEGKNGISAEELDRAKEYLTGSLMLSLESTRNVAQFWAMRQTLSDEVIEPGEVIKKLRAVKLEDVVRVAREVIRPDKRVFALVGPFDDHGKFDSLIKG